MLSLGYVSCRPTDRPQVIAYGTPFVEIDHFARVVSRDEVTAKWGQYPFGVISHSWTPYRQMNEGGFGSPVAYYRKDGGHHVAVKAPARTDPLAH